MEKYKGAAPKSKKTGITVNPEMPERIMGQVPQVHSDIENEKHEGRHVASRNEPSHRKTESKKPSKK